MINRDFQKKKGSMEGVANNIPKIRRINIFERTNKMLASASSKSPIKAIMCCLSTIENANS